MLYSFFRNAVEEIESPQQSATFELVPSREIKAKYYLVDSNHQAQ